MKEEKIMAELESIKKLIKDQSLLQKDVGYNGSNSASHSGRLMPVVPAY